MENENNNRDASTVRAIEISIRLAIIAGLVVWCFAILRPFISTLIWALIIAAALHPLYRSLFNRIKPGHAMTSFLFTSVMLVALMIPVVMLTGTLVDSAREFAAELQDGSLHVPPPPERVKTVPVVGEQTYSAWSLASDNLGEAMSRFREQIRAGASWLVSTAAGAGLGILHFALAVAVSGIFLAYSESGGQFARNLGVRLIGPGGAELADMASATVRSVAQGVLGVAVIQAILAGVAFLVMDVPGAGLWTLVVLLMATVQVPTGIILIPSIFFVGANAELVPTIAYGVWMIAVSLSDNILKPILLGRGGTAPMPVIFLGAIGGFILQGIVGLFVGAVVLVLSYKFFMMWYYLDHHAEVADGLEDVQEAIEARGNG